MSGRDYPARPIVGIGVVLWRDNAVLLVRRGRAPWMGQWSLPGGAQELGETAQACARRELLEETGLTTGPLHLAGYVDSIHHDAAGAIEYHYTIIDFCARHTGGTARPGDDVSDLAWAHPDEFDAYDLWPEARRIIRQAISLLKL